MESSQRWVIAAIVVAGVSTFVIEARSMPEDPWASMIASTWHRGEQIDIETANGVVSLMPYQGPGGRLEIAARGAGAASGFAYAADWAVELWRYQDGVVAGFADPRTDIVAIPDGASTVRVRPQAAFEGRALFWAILGTGYSNPNEIAAFDARGRKLGNQHWNVGSDGCSYSGPYDGILDRAEAPPTPRCALKPGFRPGRGVPWS